MAEEYTVDASGQVLVKAITKIPPVDKPKQIVNYIRNRSVRPMTLWALSTDDTKSKFVSRYVETVLSGNEALASRKVNVVDFIADLTVDRLNIDRWGVGKESEEAPEWVDKLEEKYGLIMTSHDLFKRAEVQGYTFMIVWVNDDREPVMVRCEPSTCCVIYYDDGTSVWPKWAARISEEGKRLDVFEKEHLTTYERPKVEGEWGSGKRTDYSTIFGEGYDLGVPVVPFASTSLHEPISGIKRAVGPQVAINHAVDITAAAVEFTAFTTTVSRTSPQTGNTDPVELERDVRLNDDFDDDDTDIFGPSDGSKKVNLYPGGWMDVVSDEVKRLPPSDPAALIDYIEFFARMAIVLSQMPMSVLAGTTANNSGELMRREIQPLIGKARQRIRLMRASYSRVWTIVGHIVGEDGTKVYPVFDDPAQPDEEYKITLAELKQNVGVEPDRALRDAGIMQPEGVTESVIRRREQSAASNGPNGPTGANQPRGQGNNN